MSTLEGMPQAFACALVAEDLHFRVPGVNAHVMSRALIASATASPDVDANLNRWAERLVDESLARLQESAQSPVRPTQVVQPQEGIL